MAPSLADWSRRAVRRILGRPPQGRLVAPPWTPAIVLPPGTKGYVTVNDVLAATSLVVDRKQDRSTVQDSLVLVVVSDSAVGTVVVSDVRVGVAGVLDL